MCVGEVGVQLLVCTHMKPWDTGGLSKQHTHAHKHTELVQKSEPGEGALVFKSHFI